VTADESRPMNQMIVDQSGEDEPGRLPRRRSPTVDASGIFWRYGILIVWLVIIVVFSILRPATFFTFGNLRTIAGSQAVLAIIALGLLTPLTAGEWDVSISSVTGVTLVLIGWLNVIHQWPIGAAVAVALLLGLAVGVTNAFFVVLAQVDSIVVTLGMGTLLIGIAIAINSVSTGGISLSLVNATHMEFLGLPLAFFYGLLLTLVFWYVFSYTPLGRYVYFVGASRSVARLSGIPVDAIRAGSLIVSAFIGALAGVVLAGWLGAADPNVSTGYLLPAFSAMFLGSSVLKPGRFNPWGTFVAVYFLVTGITGLELMGLAGWIEQVFYGASLILAVAVSRFAVRYVVARQ
jgi:ribose transport system permease protein